MTDLHVPDFEPPTSNIVRIVKSVLPDNILLTAGAKQAFVRAAAIFIFYITHCSNDFCKDAKRQTIYTQDVINALKELGFEDFEEPLQDFLEKYKREELQKKAKKMAAAKNGSGEANQDQDGEEDEMVEEDHAMDEE